MGRVGRPHKPYLTSWNEYVPDLARQKDGRWRVVSTGVRFSESDERLAVQKFKQLKGDAPPVVVRLPENRVLNVLSLHPTTDGNGNQTHKTGDVVAELDEQAMFDWMREQLISRPLVCAQRTGLPQLANFLDLPIKQDIPISKVKETYETFCPITSRAKKEAMKAFDRLVKSAGAKSLDELTTEKLLAFNLEIERDTNIKSAATRMAYYGRVKSVVAFGKKKGLSTATIDACLSRMSVLWTPEQAPAPKPQPISRDDFHTLLDNATPNWRAFLLCGLNLCMSMDEVCALRWEDFDFKEKTYAALRGKTREKRIPRAAVLWDETVKVLEALPRRGSTPRCPTMTRLESRLPG